MLETNSGGFWIVAPKENLSMFIINFKNYPGAFGKEAVDLAKEIRDASNEISNLEVFLAVPLVDIYRVHSQVDIPVFSQHVDPFLPGQTTGFSIPLAVRKAGAVGTLVNHSENPMDLDMIREAVRLCDEVELTSVVCADSPAVIDQIRDFKPDYIAFEPPELIGGDVSVVEADEFVVASAVSAAGSIPLLVGAGIGSAADVSRGLELGAEGFLVASAIVKAEDPAKAFLELIQGY
ncbi:MAG: triose-phosphate isomerase [Patescibacteria group bacterium]|nr:triose-phosphate isomerase [Patescibacteria group bacterium]